MGTRAASPDGVRRATRLARELTQAGVTVLSGLARGIDTAAHSAALGVPTGRTVAVAGQGLLTPTYPKENRELADQICGRGALVSQFWPDAPPRPGATVVRKLDDVLDVLVRLAAPVEQLALL